MKGDKVICKHLQEAIEEIVDYQPMKEGVVVSLLEFKVYCITCNDELVVKLRE